MTLLMVTPTGYTNKADELYFLMKCREEESYDQYQ